MNELVTALTELAKKLGTGLETLWPHAVRYVVVDAATTLALGFLLAGVSGWLGRKVWKRMGDMSDSDAVLAGMLWGIGVLVIWVISMVMIRSSVPALVDPQGYIITKLMTAHGAPK